MNFYDELAEQYDDLTATDRRATAAQRFVTELLTRYPMGSALDVACGTGVFTLPLAAAGVRTVGVDLSEGMLDRARRRAQQAGAEVCWVCTPMQNLPEHIGRSFDAVLCMGNSIPHLLETRELVETMHGFASLLNPGGVVILQWLHYDRVLAAGERIVGIDRDASSGRRYVRFYDLLPHGRLQFNVLTLTDTPDGMDHALHSTRLQPWCVADVTAALTAAGCGDIRTFGGLDFSPLTGEAETVLLVARTGSKDN